MDNILLINKFQQSLYDLINNCNLTVGTAFFVFKDVYANFEKIYFNEMNKELAENNKTIVEKEKVELPTTEEKRNEEIVVNSLSADKNVLSNTIINNGE